MNWFERFKQSSLIEEKGFMPLIRSSEQYSAIILLNTRVIVAS